MVKLGPGAYWATTEGPAPAGRPALKHFAAPLSTEAEAGAERSHPRIIQLPGGGVTRYEPTC